MKALKQKRISLRSLWRRGLVILSLFALVFASCSDSGSDGDDSSGSSNARVPYSIEVISGPIAKSYMGLPVDLSGIQVLARYVDGEPEVLTDPTLFDTYPRYATGYWDYVNYPTTSSPSPTFVPNCFYQLSYAVGNRVLVTDITKPMEIPDVVGIVRPNTGAEDDTKDLVNWAGVGIFSSQGLQVVSLGTTRTWYVDDQVDFSGITCEAVYEDGARKSINLTPDMPWQIIPHYNNGNNTGIGSLYVTVGRNPWYDPDYYDGDFVDGDACDPGVTAIIPLEQVYHVTKLEVETAPKLDPFFYWEDDIAKSVAGKRVNPWMDRVKDAVLLVTYSNGKTKKFTIAEALRQNEVWYNANPGGGWIAVTPELGAQKPNAVPFDVIGIYLSGGGRVDIAGTPLVPKNIARLADPVITFYYRGGQAPYKVPVYANFTQLTATLKGGANVEVDMRQNDNDFRDGMTAEKFASMVDVVATFTAFSTDVPVQKTLTYYTERTVSGTNYPGTTWENYNQSAMPTGSPNKITIPNANTPTGFEYTMDFGSNTVAWGTEGVPANINTNPLHQPDNNPDDDKYNAGTWSNGSPTLSNPGEWTPTNWGQSDNPGNNNKSTAITFYYTAPRGDFDTVGTGSSTTVAERTRNTRTNVMFRNLY